MDAIHEDHIVHQLDMLNQKRWIHAISDMLTSSG